MKRCREVQAKIVVFVAFVGAMNAASCVKLRAEGDRIGTLDLLAPDASLTIEAPAGSVLNFELGVEVPGSALGNRAARYATDDALRASTVTVMLGATDGASQQTSCGGYDGRRWNLSAIPLACKLPITRAGTYTLRASVVWANELVVHKAVLAVHRAE